MSAGPQIEIRADASGLLRAADALREFNAALLEQQRGWAAFAALLEPYPSEPDEAAAVMCSLRARAPVRRFFMAQWWQAVYVLHQATRFGRAACADCGARLTAIERWAYGATCDDCERRGMRWRTSTTE